MKNKAPITIAIIVLLLLASNVYLLYNRNTETQTIYQVRTQFDTIYKFDTTKLVITKPALKTIYKEKIDTILITQAFEKTIDTTLPNASLQVSYLFPQDTFKIKLQTKITEIMRTDTIKQTIEIPVKDEYRYLKYGGAAALGLIIGVIIAK